MSKPSLRTAALVLGVACAISLIWIWRRDGTNRQEREVRRGATDTVASSVRQAPTTGALNPASNPEMRTLLARLEAILRQGDVRARESLLTFKDDATLQRFLRRAESSGLTVIGQLPGLRTLRVRHNSFGALQNELLNHVDDYADISANYLVGVPSVPAKEDRALVDNIPFGNRTLDYLGATHRNAEQTPWGRGVTIAILDTGVSGDATFGSGRLSALDIGLGLAPEANQQAGHGTAVAALAAGFAPDAGGVAPAANVLSIRVTDASGVSDLFTISNAIVAAVDAGARIVNVSLGGYSTAPVLGAALDYATSRGAVIVAAAGNDQAAQLAWPAADSRVISVGAIDAAEQQVTFSNSSRQLQLAAPGYGVQSAWLDGQRVYLDGTSASAPLVSGAIAAVMSLNPQLSPAQAAQVLLQTASDAGNPGIDPAFGHGILNLNWAMNQNKAGYVDTAISSHIYDEDRNQLHILVQNRSAQTVTGLTLDVTTNGSNGLKYNVPSLVSGQTWVANAPADQVALKKTGSLSFTTQLVNPPGVTDAVPSNNQKTSVLNPPAPPPPVP